MRDGHPAALEDARPLRCATDQLELRKLERLVHLPEDGVEVGARFDQIGGKPVRLRRRARVLKAPSVGDERDIERLGDLRRDPHTELGEHVAQHLARRRRIGDDEIDVTEACVVVMVVDVDDGDSLIEQPCVLADAVGLRAVDRNHRAVGDVRRDGTQELVELHERVLARDRRCAGEEHDDVLAELSQREGRRDQRAERVAVRILVRDDEKAFALAQRRYDCLQVTRRLRHPRVRAHR